MASSSESTNLAVNCGEDSIGYVQLIGTGSYGEVWSARWNGRLVAAKRIHNEFFRSDYDQRVQNHYVRKFQEEWEVLRKLIHPNIIRLYTVLFPVNESPVIVTELLDCDLRAYIKRSESTPKIYLDQVYSIGHGIAEGLEYLHGLKPPVVHRDLATKNILMTTDGHPKIADLGVAKVFAAGKDAFATIVPGTPLYAAPETYPHLTGRDYCTNVKYGVKVDVFSFGVVLLEVIVGQDPNVWPLSPIKEGTIRSTKIPEVERRRKDIEKMGNHDLKQLVLDCLQDKSSKRPSASQIVKQFQRKNHKPSNSKAPPFSPGQQTVDLNSQMTGVDFEKIPSQPHYDYMFKVLLMGNSGVGKTCLVQCLRNPAFDITLTVTTLSVEPYRECFEYDSKFVTLHITDTAGQERFRFAIPPLYFRDVQGLFLVFDVTKRKTFDNLHRWINLVKEHCSCSCLQIVLVGNKVDCRNNVEKQDDIVTTEMAMEYANQHSFPYVETSAKDIDSLMDMYKMMVGILLQTVDVNDVNVDVTGSLNTSRVQLYEKKTKSKCQCQSSS